MQPTWFLRTGRAPCHDVFSEEFNTNSHLGFVLGAEDVSTLLYVGAQYYHINRRILLSDSEAPDKNRDSRTIFAGSLCSCVFGILQESSWSLGSWYTTPTVEEGSLELYHTHYNDKPRKACSVRYV